jgi:hypothetical protein
MDPCLERCAVAPARNYEDLILLVRLQDLHGDEAREILHVPATLGETVYDLIRRAFFYG